MYGELVPVGGGDTIPLLKYSLVIGRRETCDIVLRFANVSGNHCQLNVEDGYWFIQDMNSQNGIKVNGTRVQRKRLDPDAIISIAKHEYEIRYSPKDLGATGIPPPDDEAIVNIFGRSLLDSAGLKNRDTSKMSRRYDVKSDRPGQLKKKDPRDE